MDELRPQTQWVKDIEVFYGYSSDDYPGHYVFPQDVKKGFHGKDVFLRPIFTANRCEAATKFRLKTEILALLYRDLGKKRGDSYRYLLPVYNINVNRKITRIWISEVQEGDGYTGNINRCRGGKYLYLNWSLD